MQEKQAGKQEERLRHQRMIKMSSRKYTIVTCCTGYVTSPPFFGDYVTRECSECGYNQKECEEFRRSVRFTRIRSAKKVD